MNDTNDLVQITMMSALKNPDRFESAHEGALLAYLRTALMNAVRDEMRRIQRQGIGEPLPDDTQPIDTALQVPRLDSDERLDYERALAKLPELDGR